MLAAPAYFIAGLRLSPRNFLWKGAWASGPLERYWSTLSWARAGNLLFWAALLSNRLPDVGAYPVAWALDLERFGVVGGDIGVLHSPLHAFQRALRLAHEGDHQAEMDQHEQ